MRERIKKGTRGHYSNGEKEVHLSIQGKQIVQVAIRFADQSWKKVSNTGFVAIETDWDEKRLYFVPDSKSEGFKLSGEKSVRTISFTTHEKPKWERYIGDYNLLKDSMSGDYYIDLIEKEN